MPKNCRVFCRCFAMLMFNCSYSTTIYYRIYVLKETHGKSAFHSCETCNRPKRRCGIGMIFRCEEVSKFRIFKLYTPEIIAVNIKQAMEFPGLLGKHLQRPHKLKLWPMAQDICIINFQVSMDSMPDCKELFGGDSNKLLKYMKAIG